MFVCAETVLVCISSYVSDCPYEMHMCLQSGMCVFILLADMRKGQECHFVLRGCLLKGAGDVATENEVKESPGR